jgi:hypothetical protein
MPYEKYYPDGWKPGVGGNTPVTHEALEHIETGVYELHNGEITPDQTKTPVSPGKGTIFNLFNWFANRIKAITGKANWWDAPAKSIEQLNNAIESHEADYAQYKQEAPQIIRGKIDIPLRTEVVSSLPSPAEKGRIVFLDDAEPAFKGYNGGEWV